MGRRKRDPKLCSQWRDGMLVRPWFGTVGLWNLQTNESKACSVSRIWMVVYMHKSSVETWLARITSDQLKTKKAGKWIERGKRGEKPRKNIQMMKSLNMVSMSKGNIMKRMGVLAHHNPKFAGPRDSKGPDYTYTDRSVTMIFVHAHADFMRNDVPAQNGSLNSCGPEC